MSFHAALAHELDGVAIAALQAVAEGVHAVTPLSTVDMVHTLVTAESAGHAPGSDRRLARTRGFQG